MLINLCDLEKIFGTPHSCTMVNVSEHFVANRYWSLNTAHQGLTLYLKSLRSDN